MAQWRVPQFRILLALRSLGPTFHRLWVPYAVLAASDGFRRMAVLLWVYEVSGKNGLAVSLIMFAEMVPRIFLAPTAGVYVDRVGADRVFRHAVVLLALTSLAQALVAYNRWGVVFMLALVAAGAVWEVASSTASETLIPQIVSQEQLQTANAVLMSTYQAALIVGPPLGAMLYVNLGRTSVFLIDAVLLFLSSALLLRLVAQRLSSAVPAPGTFGLQLLEGLWYLARHRILLALASTAFLVAFSAGINSTTMIFFIEDLGYRAADIAWLGAANGLFQLVAGGLIVALAHRIPNTPWLLGVGLGILAVGAAGQATALNFVWLIVAVLVGSIGNNPFNIAYSTLLQSKTEVAVLGRVKSLTGTVVSTTFLLGAGVAGVLLSRYPSRSLLVLSATVIAVAFFLYLFMLRGRLAHQRDGGDSAQGDSLQ